MESSYGYSQRYCQRGTKKWENLWILAARGPKNATVTYIFTGSSVTFKGSVLNIEAEAGPLDRYKVFSINGIEPTTDLSAAYDEDLHVDLMPGTNTVKLSTVVNFIDGCGVLESDDTIDFVFFNGNNITFLSESLSVKADGKIASRWQFVTARH